jgi:hypothetical protein
MFQKELAFALRLAQRGPAQKVPFTLGRDSTWHAGLSRVLGGVFRTCRIAESEMPSEQDKGPVVGPMTCCVFGSADKSELTAAAGWRDGSIGEQTQ